jgi:hypothetical protein
MMGLNVGDKVKVRYADGISEYTLDVEVTKTYLPKEFLGRVERVFAADGPGKGSEITGGDILGSIGTEKTFKNVDIRK